MKKAFTLIELMVAMTLSLLLLLAVAKMFQGVGDTINDTQATLNMAANMNNVAMILREDLDAIVRCTEINNANKMVHERDFSEAEGYLEIIEGDNNEITYVDSDNGNAPDPTVGDVNDILTGTGKVVGANRNYRGLINGTVIESNYAEIIWFVRGTTLYRQTKLIIGHDQRLRDLIPDSVTNFHSTNDVSVAMSYKRDSDGVIERDNNGEPVRLFSINTVQDLTRRENRFAKFYATVNDPNPAPFPYPHDPKYRDLRLPTMAELDGNAWFNVPSTTPHPSEVDLWNNPNYAINYVRDPGQTSPGTHQTVHDNGWLETGSRAGEDVVLTNVISFDIRVWDHVTQSFINLGDDVVDTDNDGVPDTNTGAFGSQGRYSGNDLPYERLVTEVNFDENYDMSDEYSDPPTNSQKNLHYHDISEDYNGRYLYQEDKQGNKLPLSNIDPLYLPPPSPGSPPSPPELPDATLRIGRWPDAATCMPRVFDTWSSIYERTLRVGGGVAGFVDADVPHVDIRRAIVATQAYSRTQFNLVTFGPKKVPPGPSGIVRWYYLHSQNIEPSSPPVPAPKFFNTYQHTGTGMFIDKTSDLVPDAAGAYWETPPPYDERLRGIEITIRCFDPKSGNIRQVRVVKNMR